MDDLQTDYMKSALFIMICSFVKSRTYSYFCFGNAFFYATSSLTSNRSAKTSRKSIELNEITDSSFHPICL